MPTSLDELPCTPKRRVKVSIASNDIFYLGEGCHFCCLKGRQRLSIGRLRRGELVKTDELVDKSRMGKP